MQLPPDILSNINHEFSRHQHPEDLDWQLERGKWTASTGPKKFIVLHDDTLGYVIAEVKGVSYGIGMELHHG